MVIKALVVPDPGPTWHGFHFAGGPSSSCVVEGGADRGSGGSIVIMGPRGSGPVLVIGKHFLFSVVFFFF